jgi:hypothetical protein
MSSDSALEYSKPWEKRRISISAPPPAPSLYAGQEELDLCSCWAKVVNVDRFAVALQV